MFTRFVRPRRAWVPAHPRELWSFRELAVRFAARDITLRYRQTLLGALWVVVVGGGKAVVRRLRRLTRDPRRAAAASRRELEAFRTRELAAR